MIAAKRTFRITFLGTCACDFSPRLETELKDKFDLDARRSSSVLINDSVLIDCGPHTLNSLDILSIPYSQITDLLVTHLHSDHFDSKNIEILAKDRHTPLKIWVREDAEIENIPNVEIMRMKPYEHYFVGGFEGFTVTGMLANHIAESFPQHFLIERNRKKIFYGCDGAWLLSPTYYHLCQAKLDMAVFDCTTGDYVGDYRMAEHNSIPMLRLMLPSLEAFGVIDGNTKVYFSHLAPSLHESHHKTVEIARGMNADVAYDGLSVNI